MIAFAIALAAATPPAPVDPGPAPSWDQAVAMGNQEILTSLIDPESARVSWPYRFFGGFVKPMFAKRQVGWITCGMVNAKNRMGGYVGAKPFLIVIRDGKVASLDMDFAAEVSCQDFAKRGFLTASGAPTEPAAVDAANTVTPQAIEQASATIAETALKQGGIGISYVPSPAGIVLLAVAPGSPASAAGLHAGQVIERANGVDLRGMQQVAVIAVLKGLPKILRFAVVGAGEVVVNRP
jgi:hypothetical protein